MDREIERFYELEDKLLTWALNHNAFIEFRGLDADIVQQDENEGEDNPKRKFPQAVYTYFYMNFFHLLFYSLDKEGGDRLEADIVFNKFSEENGVYTFTDTYSGVRHVFDSNADHSPIEVNKERLYPLRKQMVTDLHRRGFELEAYEILIAEGTPHTEVDPDDPPDVLPEGMQYVYNPKTTLSYSPPYFKWMFEQGLFGGVYLCRLMNLVDGDKNMVKSRYITTYFEEGTDQFPEEEILKLMEAER